MRQSALRSPVLQKARQWRMSSYSWTAPPVALGVQCASSARVRGVRDGGSGVIASRCVEIPLVGSDGEVSGVLCYTGPRSDTRGAVAPRG